MRQIALLVLLLPLLGGCGYRFGDVGLPGDVRAIYLEQVVNRTTEPLLENVFLRPLTAQLGKRRGVRLCNSIQQADAVLTTEVLKYDVDALSFAATDRISTYQATMEAGFSLKRVRSGELLWQGVIRRQANYVAAADKNLQENLEAQAQETLGRNIAEDVVQQLISRF